MMNALSKIIKDLLTGRSNETHDIGRWSWLCSSLAVCAAGVWNATHGVVFDLTQVATALGIVAGAHGGALMMKSKTEPEQKAD